MLQQNCSGLSNVRAIQKAVSDTVGEMQFYEFPNLYSEYNSSDVRQFETEKWYRQFQPVIHNVQTVTIDSIVESQDLRPHLIKIDVEGAELSVLRGGKIFLQNHSPMIVMEYLSAGRSNQPHREAVTFMKALGYQTNIILNEGSLQPVEDIEACLTSMKTDSDNIVFVKPM